MTTAETALDYRPRGLSVIPISPETKKPLAKWKRFQRAPADEATISKWSERWPDANVAIVTGVVSGVIVLDADHLLGTVNLGRMCISGQIWSAVTARGCHIYLGHPCGGIRIPTQAGVLPYLDVKADGGYVLAPPSIHPSGHRYEWWDPPADTISAVEPAVVALLLAKPRPKANAGPITKGSRNNTLYRRGRSLWAKGLDAEDMEDALLVANAERCAPPLSEAEVRAIAAHVATQQHREDFTQPDAARAEVDAYTQKLRRRADTWRWPTRSAPLYRGVLEAHLLIMERSGRFAYAASLRELAELAGRAKRDVERAQCFLRAEDWLTLQKGAPRGVREAAIWTVHVPRASRITAETLVRQTGSGTRLRLNGSPLCTPYTPTAKNVPIRIVMMDLSAGWADRLSDRECPDRLSPGYASCDRECPNPLSHDLWCRRWKGAKGLGASCGKVYVVLHQTVPLPVRALAKRFQVSPTSLHRVLAILGQHGLAIRSKTGWLRGPADVDAVAIELGVAGRSEAVRDEHRRQRERFDEALAVGWRLGRIRSVQVGD